VLRYKAIMNSVRGDGPASPASAPTAIAGGSAGKRRANSKLGQMRFMQRAAQKVAATAVNGQVAYHGICMQYMPPYMSMQAQALGHSHSCTTFNLSCSRHSVHRAPFTVHLLLQTPAGQDPMRWEASADGDGGGGGCVVISEDAPLPGAGLGHMSFGGFSPALEAMQVRMRSLDALIGIASHVPNLCIVVWLQLDRAWLPAWPVLVNQPVQTVSHPLHFD
jgi:hypothetical protein